MSFHSGIECDKCECDPLAGCRYACMICVDYDHCEDCYQKESFNKGHQAFYPMLPILALTDRDRALKNRTPIQIKIFNCPYCGEGGLNIDMLATHCLEYHPFKSCKVRCPICVTYHVQNKYFWIAEDTLLLHLLINQQNEDGFVLDLTEYECPFHGNCINNNTCPLC